MIKALIKRFPLLLKWYSMVKLSIGQAKFLPNNIKLNYSGHKLFADPWESRGLALLNNKGDGQPIIKNFWRRSLSIFNPDLALDIGANYGEILYDTEYPDSTINVIGIEANPKLIPFLEKSKSFHPDKEKITLINGIASDNNSDNVSFYIDQKSSGRSTPLKNNFVKKSKRLEINSIRVDQYLERHQIKPNRIVFKIDVEGFEPYVLRGMSSLLKSNKELIGCIEFNLTVLEKNKINVEEYLEFLNDKFESLVLRSDGRLETLGKLSVNSLKKVFKNGYVEGDILLFSTNHLLQKFKNNYNNNI